MPSLSHGSRKDRSLGATSGFRPTLTPLVVGERRGNGNKVKGFSTKHKEKPSTSRGEERGQTSHSVPGSTQSPPPSSSPVIMLFPFLLFMPLASANLTELTFELADREIQCFYEELQKDAKCNFVFQVVAGGHYDVDCFIEDPRRRMIYRKHKIRQDSLAVKVELSGVYSFCFGNQFSTFSHKKIYFHLEVGEEIPIFATAEGKDSALTQLEASCLSIHTALRSVMSMQTQQRVQALIDHLHAEDVNSHIIYWASSETIILFLVTVGQLIIVKRFFTDQRANISVATT